MKVSLLGPVSAETDGAPLRLGGRKQRAVFALLALQVNSPVALDRLVHELWRDEPPAQATLSLQSYISRLRRTIADAHDGAEQAPRILTRPPGWSLVMPGEDVDAVRFTDLAREGHTLLREGCVDAGAATLTEALALWRGEALADLDDMPFAAGEKARLEDLRLSLTESLLEAELELGRPTGVAETARHLVSENPYRERAWCALMLALYRLGRQAEALDVAQELRTTLADGLGLDPSPEARRLQEQILNQDPALDQGARATRHVASGPTLTEVGVETGAETVAVADDAVATGFVGRHDVTAALDAVAVGAARGNGAFVVVDGPAGMGKSAVLHELTTRLQNSDALVLRGGGVSAGATPALWPWVAILRQLVTAVPEVAGAASRDGAAAALSLLDPSVGTAFDDEGRGAGADPVLARTRLYRAVVDLLGTAHHARPLALLVDDAHWLDADTLGLLALASDELVPQGVVVAVALRADESPDVSAEIDAVAARHRAETVRLPLTGLSTSEVEEIVRHASSEGEHEALAAALAARTGGNPFFVGELLRLLTSERRLDVTSVDNVLPQGVRDVLRRRIDRLPDRTRALLTVVALLNRPAEVRLLTDVTGLSVEAALDDAESAVASSLLIEDPTTGAFTLSHDLVRQTLEEMVSASRRARMHARIAEVMRSDELASSAMLPETVVEIARHLVLAEPVVGPEAAIPYLVTVADDAREHSAFHLAERALRTALDLSGRVGDPVRRASLQLELRTRVALQSNLIAGPPGSRIFSNDDPIDPSAVPAAATDPLAWWGAAVMHVAEGRARVALGLAEEALARPLPDNIAAVVHSVAGLSHFETGRLDLADHHLDRAEQIGERVRQKAMEATGHLDPWIPSMRVSAPAIRSAVAVLMDDRPTASAHLDRARERARSAPNELVLAEHFAAWGAAVAGDPGTALPLATTAVELGGRLGDTFYVPMSRIILGWARAMLGEETGIGVARSSYDECASMGLQFQATVHLMLCAEAAAHHGRLDEARALVEESRSMADLTGERTLGSRLEHVADGILTAGG